MLIGERKAEGDENGILSLQLKAKHAEHLVVVLFKYSFVKLPFSWVHDRKPTVGGPKCIHLGLS
ncbi:hypothetical protein D3C81_2102480 [compost metagenome]